jgi:hypothetical protein
MRRSPTCTRLQDWAVLAAFCAVVATAVALGCQSAAVSFGQERAREVQPPAAHPTTSGGDSGPTSVSSDTRPPPGLGESFGGAIPGECWGAVVHLSLAESCQCRLRLRTLPEGHVSSRNSCSERYYGTDLRDALDVQLVTGTSHVKSGETAQLGVAIDNKTSADLGLVFRRLPHHDPESYPDMVKVFDTEGNERTTVGPVSVVSAVGGDYLVVLAPNGRARYGIVWRAATVNGTVGPDGTRCEDVPLPPGSYRVAFRLPFHESLRLTQAQRLPSAPIEVTAAP